MATTESTVARKPPFTARIAKMRLIPFLAAGGIGATAELLILAFVSHAGLHPIASEAVAITFSSQLNFTLNNLLTWRDRRGLPLWGRWLRFNLSTVGTQLLKLGVFAIAHHFMPTVVAGAVGLLVASVGNYLLADRMVFRRTETREKS